MGLGGGSVAKRYAADGWRVDAVEIDPEVSELALNHFGLRPEEAAVHHGDGRRFLADRPVGSYDLVILDAFGSSSIPFHLVTREVFALVRSRLAPGGLLAMNVEADRVETATGRRVTKRTTQCNHGRIALSPYSRHVIMFIDSLSRAGG